MSHKNEHRAGYKRTRLGWIPEDWKSERLKTLVKTNDQTLPESTDDDKSFYYLTLSDINNGQITKPELMINFKEAPGRARRIFHRGNILLSTVRPNLKGFAYVDFDADDFICSTGFAVIEGLIPTKVVIKYLYHTLFSEMVTRYFFSCVVGSNYPALNNSDITNMKIPLPPLPEQKKIAEILTTWDKAIEQVEALIAAKQQLKKGLMQQLLTGKQRFPEFGPPAQDGELPEGWREVRLGDVFSIIKRKNKSKNDFVLSISGQYGLISQRDFFNKSVAGLDKSGYYLLKRGEFAYNRSFMKGYPFGAIKRLEKYEEGILSTLYICFGSKTQCIDTGFFKYYFDGGILNQELYKIVQMGARAHGLLNVTLSDFLKCKLIIPALSEQKIISHTLSKMDNELILLNSNLDLLNKQKQGLMQKLMTGEVRVKL